MKMKVKPLWALSFLIAILYNLFFFTLLVCYYGKVSSVVSFFSDLDVTLIFLVIGLIVLSLLYFLLVCAAKPFQRMNKKEIRIVIVIVVCECAGLILIYPRTPSLSIGYLWLEVLSLQILFYLYRMKQSGLED
ncbi:hypothetical protein A7X67_00570 [Clostridium sp. W14A]|nr:hypothetical protein A7X67_00570 [Clostridium sp. W14A]